MSLKSSLIELKDSNYEVFSNFDLDELIVHMLEQIGTTDSELRDNLIYHSFIQFILNDHLDNKQLQLIIETCLDDDHLFYKIGEKNSDSVFTRSFSALIIGAVLEKDKNSNFLPLDIVNDAIQKSRKYLILENDTRGYVDKKGWAHSIAHGADLLDSAIRHSKFNMDDQKEFLETITNCLFKELVYMDDEDNRLICSIETLIEKGLNEEIFEKWLLEIFSDLELLYENENSTIRFYRTKINVMNFIKTLYFRLAFIDKFSNSRELIGNNLKKWHRRFY